MVRGEFRVVGGVQKLNSGLGNVIDRAFLTFLARCFSHHFRTLQINFTFVLRGRNASRNPVTTTSQLDPIAHA